MTSLWPTSKMPSEAIQRSDSLPQRTPTSSKKTAIDDKDTPTSQMLLISNRQDTAGDLLTTKLAENKRENVLLNDETPTNYALLGTFPAPACAGSFSPAHDPATPD